MDGGGGCGDDDVGPFVLDGDGGVLRIRDVPSPQTFDGGRPTSPPRAS